MKIISWNLNSRSNKLTLEGQCSFLKSGKFDFITLQEVTMKSQIFIKECFKDHFLVSSFDLAKNHEELVGKRKYGQIIISKYPFRSLDPDRIKIPFPERVLSVKIEKVYENLEIYTTHIPPGSSNGVIKVQHFEGLFDYLKTNQESKILTGDFNSPKEERDSGEIITWGQKINKNGVTRLAVNPKWKNECTAERWDAAERSIIQNNNKLGMKDAYREVNGKQAKSFSWFLNRKDIQLGRRYDHIFCSKELNPISCFYDQKPRKNKLSDHSPVIAEIS
tara:strand:+ start:174 stop:1004 length:831 start_codon:yes stop_codon:yes gene_type:complete